MILGRVAGEVVTTIAHPFYGGRTLLLVERTDPAFRPTGAYLVAVDAVGAGVGQHVLVLDEGNGARQVFAAANAPVRSVVVGIVDHVAGEAHGTARTVEEMPSATPRATALTTSSSGRR